ncbi:hypothetical protein VTH06DRAFT_4979 [Thermothelomyces fergusii]
MSWRVSAQRHSLYRARGFLEAPRFNKIPNGPASGVAGVAQSIVRQGKEAGKGPPSLHCIERLVNSIGAGTVHNTQSAASILKTCNAS